MKDDYIRVRCTSSDKAMIMSRAKDKDLTMSEYILRCCQVEILSTRDRSAFLALCRLYDMFDF